MKATNVETGVGRGTAPPFRENTPAWLAGIAPEAVAGIDGSLLDAVFTAYQSPGRYYHSWQHILNCLAQFKRTTFDEPRAVLLALLFHDAIYVAGRRDNERESADLAARLMQDSSNVTARERDAVVEMILLTASHHIASPPSEDAGKFLDIDLSVLGADWPRYEAYARGVRREFCPSVVGDFKFCLGRCKFLKSVLAQPHIFLTPAMRSRCEHRARENIAREIAGLAMELGWIGRLIARWV